jgi:uncharacterized membrane protein
MAQVYGNDKLATVFVTDRHRGSDYTLFIPSGPNTSWGCSYGWKEKYVHPVAIPEQDVMRVIISCGIGAAKLLLTHRMDNTVSRLKQQSAAAGD